jgi:putative oxidoreductase
VIAESAFRYTLTHTSARALRIILGIIFIYAGISKILSPEDFAVIIDNYRILPFIFVKPFAILIPWVEVTAGACLVCGYFVSGGLLIIDILMIVFILAFVISLIRGIDIACGCFSLSLVEKKNVYYYLARDLLLLGGGVCLLSFEIKRNNALFPGAAK